MNIEQLNKEINDINNDTTITEEEKNTYLSIYTAELERQKYDSYISKQKQLLEGLRKKIIDDIMNIYTSLDEEKKEIAENMLQILGHEASVSANNYFHGINDVVNTIETGSENTTLYEFLDDNIHKELEQIMKIEKEFRRFIANKYTKLGVILLPVVDSKIFDFESKENPGEYKTRSEYDELYTKANSKINNLNIGAKEKGILRNIILDAVKYGLSYGTMYEQLPDLSDYIEAALNLNQEEKRRGM